MIKHQTILALKRNDRTYQLHLSNDSPLGELFDVLTEMRAYVINRMQEVTKPEAKNDEEPKE